MARSGKKAVSPEARPEKPNGVLVAAGGYEAGRPITDREDLAVVMARQLELMSREARSGKVIVASAKFDYPTERQVHNSPDDIGIVERSCGPQAPAYDPRTGQALGQSLVATGGICQPVDVDYSVPTWATADTTRPSTVCPSLRRHEAAFASSSRPTWPNGKAPRGSGPRPPTPNRARRPSR